MGPTLNYRAMWLIFFLLLRAQEAAGSASGTLDYQYYKTKVEPLFL